MRKTKGIRLLGKLLFLLYLGFAIYFLIFSDWYGRSGDTGAYLYNLEPFKEIRRFWYYRHQLGWWSMSMNILGNVFIFLPFGIFLPMASKKRQFGITVLAGFFFSLCVEGFQLLTRVGSFDVDDLILNTTGCILGYVVFGIISAIRRKNEDWKKNKNRAR